MEKMHEVSFEKISDGSIRLEQQYGVDAPDVICLHPEQLRFISRTMTGMGDADAGRAKDLERRLSVIADHLETLVCAKWLRHDIRKHCDDGIEIIARLDGLLDLAIEFDGGRLLPSISPGDPPESPVLSPITAPGIDFLQPGETNHTKKECTGQCVSDDTFCDFELTSPS